MFNKFKWGQERFKLGDKNKLKKDPKNIDLDKMIAKTQQHGDESKKPENLKKEEGEMFGNPYGENAYNLPGHEDEERLRDKGIKYEKYSSQFVPNEDVADKSAVGAIYRQAEKGLKNKKIEEAHDHEEEFMRKARKVLDDKEYEHLSSFFKELDEKDIRKDYIGYSNERGTFVPPPRRTPRDITDLIKRVNEQRRIIKSAENKYDDEGKLIGIEEKEVPADQVRFKTKGFEKKEKKQKKHLAA